MKRTPLKRKTPLKRVSKKRAKLMRTVAPARKEFRLAVGVCMLCRQNPASENHEIARGPAREKCLEVLDLQLCVCRSCHDSIQHAHPADQLALRTIWDIDYRTLKYNELMGRNLIDAEDVIARLMFRNLKD
jgi:hypothetical protein